MITSDGAPKAEVTRTSMGSILWTRHDCITAPLNYRGHLRFLQGAPLSELFFPLLLLKGTPDKIWRVPFVLQDVILAEVHEAPESMSPEKITRELMRVVFASARTT